MFLVFGLFVVFLTDNTLADSKVKSAKCIGKHRMPLDETNVQIKHQRFKPFAFDGLNEEPYNAEILNVEGSLSIKLDYNEPRHPIVYGGALEQYGNYLLDGILWHWLKETIPENDLGDIRFPAEWHLKFYHEDYLTRNDYGVIPRCVVLAFPFKVVKETKFRFFKIVEQHLPMVRMPNDIAFLPNGTLPWLAEILNRNLSQFYSYYGETCYLQELTKVVWLDFVSLIEIGVDFVQQVEYLEATGGKPLMEQVLDQKGPQGLVIKSFRNIGVRTGFIIAAPLLVLLALLLQI
ncbi:uncharacterized protein [Musca autumnalis]|uniref:uncharacterized protein n=1 Tax=Musca autumnalis TaxID=221902 RepID=UPI003CFAADF6